jgi:hypothetical protein
MIADLYRSLVVFLALLVFAGAGMGYCAGRLDGKRDVKLERNGARIQVATSRRTQAEEVSMRAIERTTPARAERREARKRVEIVDDTTLTVDSLLVNMPRPVVSLIRSSDTQSRTDSIAIVALQRQVTALEEERDAWKERAELLKPPRFDVVDGAIAGGSVATAAAVVITTGSVASGGVVLLVGGATVLLRKLF